MKKVNWYMLNDLLNPLGGTADIDDKIHQYQNFNSNNEIAVKKIITEEIKPYFENSHADYKIALKSSLSYFLSINKIDFGRLYDSCLISFDHPKDPRKFFIWIWEILFPGEDYKIINNNEYIEVENINEPYRYHNS